MYGINTIHSVFLSHILAVAFDLFVPL